MFEIPYLKMICDSNYGGGGVFFYEEYFEWVGRGRKSDSGFKIYYKDIEDVKIIYGGKKTLTVYLKDGATRNFYLYKADTLRLHIHNAIERIEGKNKIINNEEPSIKEVKVKEENSDDIIVKLEKLKKLHDSGDITDEEFALAKKKIIG